MLTEKICHRIYWDYDVDVDVLNQVLYDQLESWKGISKVSILCRVFERLNWHTVRTLFDIEYLRKNLTEQLISMFRFPDIREDYEQVRRVLHNEALSVSGWDSVHRERFGNSFLSDRWNRT